jgi:transcriptional regulator with GAF, ATPase, and Fis domain
MKDLYVLVGRIAPSPINVLILGETGVGKEVVAETIHRRSPRADAPVVRINCAALSEALLESELFGHEKGAFTGAVSAKPGLIEVANGGTVFLDEVGELTPSLQAKLLRVLEAREVTRVGGLRPRPVDVRFISATNRDLETEVTRGAFRSDLFFRLNGLSVVVPPLRDRKSEIVPLAELFLARVCDQMSLLPRPTLTAQAIDLMKAHPWPGNVRELRNAIERAVLLCSDGLIGPGDLGLGQLALAAPRVADPGRSTASPGPMPVGRSEDKNGSPVQARDSRPDHHEERQRIVEALDTCNGNQTRAAKLLGMPRRTLVTKLTAHNIPRPRKIEGL